MAILRGLYSSYNNNWFTQLGVYSFATTDGSLGYVHLKTNVPKTRNTMWMIEFVGYNYGSLEVTRSAICFHTSGGTIYNIGVHKFYIGGVTPQAAYSSTDGYVVIRTNASFYYSGFVINAYSTAPYAPNEAFTITAASQNNNSGTGTY